MPAPAPISGGGFGEAHAFHLTKLPVFRCNGRMKPATHRRLFPFPPFGDSPLAHRWLEAVASMVIAGTLLLWPGGAECQEAKVAPDPSTSDGAKPVPTGVELTAEWIEVDLAALPGLLKKHGGEDDSRPLYDEVLEMIEAKAAERVEMVFGRLPLGDNGSIRSVEEVIYPTEYDPPEIPNTVTIEGGNADNIPISSAMPAAFETRDVGTRIETENEVDDSGRIVLEIGVETVSHLGRDYLFPKESKEHKEMSVIWMPRFHTMAVHTRVTLRPGAFALIGTFKPPSAEKADKRLLLFVQARFSTNRTAEVQ